VGWNRKDTEGRIDKMGASSVEGRNRGAHQTEKVSSVGQEKEGEDRKRRAGGKCAQSKTDSGSEENRKRVFQKFPDGLTCESVDWGKKENPEESGGGQRSHGWNGGVGIGESKGSGGSEC